LFSNDGSGLTPSRISHW